MGVEMEATQIMMRQQMVQTLTDLLEADERLVTLLGNISASLFDKRLFRARPQRVYDVGISEQAMVSMAAGLALEGLIPVVHTIAPFLAERAFEQIKDDFCYQQLGGNFISIGASYDYSTEGMTHQGSGDVQILRSLPGMRIVVPGAAAEFDTLFRASYADGQPTYYRLSERQNDARTAGAFRQGGGDAPGFAGHGCRGRADAHGDAGGDRGAGRDGAVLHDRRAVRR